MDISANISGTLVDSVTGLPINNGSIYIFDLEANFIKSTEVTTNGDWHVNNLPSGDYKLISESTDYLATLYEQSACHAPFYYNSCRQFFNAGLVVSHSSSNTQNIELKQIKGAQIHGTVFDASGSPLNKARIFVFDKDFNQIFYSIYSRIRTDSNGNYSTFLLSDGEYYIYADEYYKQGELYPNIFCHLAECDYTQATPITINNRVDVNNINFNLNKPATVAGKIIDSTGTALNTQVQIRGITNSMDKFVNTNSLGEYIFDFVPAGDYEVYVDDENYYSMIYNNIECDDVDCLNETSSVISVTDNDVTNINFTLNSLEKITFNYTTTTGNALDSGSIEVYDTQGNLVKGFNGINTDILLPAGDYYFYFKGYNFLSKIYGGNNCSENCDPTTGTLVTVAKNSNVSLNMNLDEYFYIDITSTIGRATVVIYNEDYTFYTTFNTENDHKHIRSLQTKYLKLSKSQYYSKIYNNVNCYDANCDITLGTPINPQVNGTLSINVDDLILISGESISGVITDAAGATIEGMKLDLFTNFNQNNFSHSFAYTDVNGKYQFSNIHADSYYLRAEPDGNSHLQQTYYGNVACNYNCNDANLPTINLTIGEQLTGYDIQLLEKGSLSIDGIASIFAENIPIDVLIYDENLILIEIIRVAEDGSIPQTQLLSGNYKIILRAGNQFSLYPSGICESNVETECAVKSEFIRINAGENTHISGMVAHQFGFVQGVVTDRITGNPVAGAIVNFYSNNGEFIAASEADSSGVYKVTLKKGSYFIYTTGHISSFYPISRNFYISQLLGGIDCVQGLGVDCVLTNSDMVQVNADAMIEVNISLKPKPQLKVNLIDKISGRKVITTNADIKIYQDNIEVKAFNILSSLEVNYLTPNIPYQMIVEQIGGGYKATGYPDILCQSGSLYGCESHLTPIVLPNDSNLHEIDVVVIVYQGINGYVVDQTTGIGLKDVYLDFWDSNGRHRRSTKTFNNGGFSIGLIGDYFVSTDARSEYVNEIYKDVPCEEAAIFGNCNLSQGELIYIPRDNSTPIMLEITLNKIIFKNGFEAQ